MKKIKTLSLVIAGLLLVCLLTTSHSKSINHDHIWVYTTTDTVVTEIVPFDMNKFKPIGIVEEVRQGIYYELGENIVCLFCKSEKRQIIKTIYK